MSNQNIPNMKDILAALHLQMEQYFSQANSVLTENTKQPPLPSVSELKFDLPVKEKERLIKYWGYECLAERFQEKDEQLFQELAKLSSCVQQMQADINQLLDSRESKENKKTGADDMEHSIKHDDFLGSDDRDSNEGCVFIEDIADDTSQKSNDTDSFTKGVNVLTNGDVSKVEHISNTTSTTNDDLLARIIQQREKVKDNDLNPSTKNANSAEVPNLVKINTGLPESINIYSRIYHGACLQKCSSFCDHLIPMTPNFYESLRDEIRKPIYGSFVAADISQNQVDVFTQNALPPEIKENYLAVSTPADGHCLYHAVSFSLFQSTEAYFLLRRIQQSEITLNKSFYEEVYLKLNASADFQILMMQSSSPTAWGNSQSINVLSALIGRQIHVYSFGQDAQTGWILYDMLPDLSKSAKPIYLVNYNRMHFTSLIPNTPNPEHGMSSRKPYLTIPPGMIYPGFCTDKFGNISAEDFAKPTTNTNRQSPVERNESTDASKHCPKQCVFDPSILQSLDLEEYCINRNENMITDLILFANILRDEVLEGPEALWNENLPILSVRMSYLSFWQKKISSIKHRYPSSYITKKCNAMCNIVNNSLNYAFIAAALRQLGVPLVQCESYSLHARNEHIEAFKKNFISKNEFQSLKRKPKRLLPNYIQPAQEEVQTVPDLNQTKSQENMEAPKSADSEGSSPIQAAFDNEISSLATCLNIDTEVLNYKPPDTFSFTVPSVEMENVFDFDSGMFRKRKYVAVLSKYLTLEQKCCSFTATHTAYVGKSSEHYATIYGACGCKMKFTIKVLFKPEKGRDTKCSVTSEGVFKLIQENPVSRTISGVDRTNLYDKLKLLGPSRLHMDRYLETSYYRILHNNLPERSLAVLRQIHAESKDSVEKDCFEDIRLFEEEIRKDQQEKILKGFVQNLDQLPDQVNILMYSEESLKLLTTLQRKEELILHFDATGSVVTSKGMTKKQAFLYLAVAKSRSYTFPVCEGVSQRGRSIDISEMLGRVKTSATLLYKQMKRLVGIAVSDFSFAMLHGMLRGLNNMTMQDYFLLCYRVLKDEVKFPGNRSVIFICSAHLIHAFSNLISKKVTKQLKVIALHSLAKIQETADIQSFIEAIDCVCRLFESPHLETEELETMIAFIKNHSAEFDFESDTVPEEPEVEILNDFEDANTLKSSSPFYHLMVQQRKNLACKRSTSTIPNPFHSPVIVNLLQDHYIPYTPMFAAMILNKSGRLNETRVTNCRIEGEFNFVKNCFHGGQKQPLNIFVRENYKYHKGRVLGVLQTAFAMERKTRKRSRKTEKDDSCAKRTAECQQQETLQCGVKRKKLHEAFVKETWSKRKPKSAIPLYFSQQKQFNSEREKLRGEQAANIGPTVSAEPSLKTIDKDLKAQNEESTVNAFPLGLVNLGQTCYLNSLMQALFAIPSIRQKELPTSLSMFFDCIYLFKNTAKESVIRRAINILSEEIIDDVPTDIQQDAFEFFLKFLDMENMELRKAFHLEKVRKLTCSCGNSRESRVTSFHLEAIDFISDQDVNQSKFFEKTELLAVSCGAKSCPSLSMLSSEAIAYAPEVLCVQEDIFRFEDGIGTKKPKNSRKKEATTNIQVQVNGSMVNYELCSMIVHSGIGINRGHYVAYVKALDQQWILCNDEFVNILQQKPSLDVYDLYLSFYRKV